MASVSSRATKRPREDVESLNPIENFDYRYKYIPRVKQLCSELKLLSMIQLRSILYDIYINDIDNIFKLKPLIDNLPFLRKSDICRELSRVLGDTFVVPEINFEVLYEEKLFPSWMIDNIGDFTLINDPITLTSSGQTYQRSSINKWLESKKKTDPITRIKIPKSERKLIMNAKTPPSIKFRDAVNDYLLSTFGLSIDDIKSPTPKINFVWKIRSQVPLSEEIIKKVISFVSNIRFKSLKLPPPVYSGDTKNLPEEFKCQYLGPFGTEYTYAVVYRIPKNKFDITQTYSTSTTKTKLSTSGLAINLIIYPIDIGFMNESNCIPLNIDID